MGASCGRTWDWTVPILVSEGLSRRGSHRGGLSAGGGSSSFDFGSEDPPPVSCGLLEECPGQTRRRVVPMIEVMEIPG